MAAWEGGAALAGCSAGAAALSEVAHELPTGVRRLGLGLIGGLVVIPHFDRVERRAPEIIGRAVSSLADGQLLVGIDENTALVGGPDRWRVRGRGRVSAIDTEGCRHVHPADTEFDLRCGARRLILYRRCSRGRRASAAELRHRRAPARRASDRAGHAPTSGYTTTLPRRRCHTLTLLCGGPRRSRRFEMFFGAVWVRGPATSGVKVGLEVSRRKPLTSARDEVPLGAKGWGVLSAPVLRCSCAGRWMVVVGRFDCSRSGAPGLIWVLGERALRRRDDRWGWAPHG